MGYIGVRGARSLAHGSYDPEVGFRVHPKPSYGIRMS